MPSFGVAHSSSIRSTAHPASAGFVAGAEEVVSELPLPALVSADVGAVGNHDRAVAYTLGQLRNDARRNLAIHDLQLLRESFLLIMKLMLLLLETFPLLLQFLSRASPCCLELHPARKVQVDGESILAMPSPAS